MKNRNNAQNRSSREGEEPPRSVAATTGCPWLPPRSVVVTTGRPWWPLAAMDRFCPVRRFLPFFSCFAGYLFWAICIGLFELICFLSSLGLMSNPIILIKVGLKLENLQENSTGPKPSIIGEIADKMQINAN